MHILKILYLSIFYNNNAFILKYTYFNVIEVVMSRGLLISKHELRQRKLYIYIFFFIILQQIVNL